MSKYNLVPLIGSVPSLDMTMVSEPDRSPQLRVKSWSPHRRFAIEACDDGLDSFGLSAGNYGIFREQRWPDNECQICCIAFGDNVTLRILEGLYDTEPTLRVAGDKIEPIMRHRNEFIVLGILDGVIDVDFAEIDSPVDDVFDWGC